MSQEPLNQSDIERFADLLDRSKQPEILGREILCRKIAIDPKTLGFIRQAGDYSFALELINYLNDIDDQEALCKLCHEIYPTFRKGIFAPEIANILTKLNCNHELKENNLNNQPVEQQTFSSEFSPNFPHQPHRYRSQPQSWFSIVGNAKNRLFAGGAILIIGLGLAGLYIDKQNMLNPDYARLQKLLADQDWKGADQETAINIWKAVNREQEKSLREEDFKKIPCEDLQAIDKLWVKYSENHFGFSVQRRIWSDVNSDLGEFIKKVGWGDVKRESTDSTIVFVYNGINLLPFDLSAPKGQLPVEVTYDGGNNETRRKYMSKLVECFPNP